MLRVLGRRAWSLAQKSGGSGSRVPALGDYLCPVLANHHLRSGTRRFCSRPGAGGVSSQERSGPVESKFVGIPGILSRVSAIRSALVFSPWGRLMRLDKPIGTYLLFLPTAWGITLGASSVGDAVSLYALTFAGSVIMRGAGCTMNDIWDADVDGLVERTKNRPIAAGEVSIPAAFGFLGAQLAGGCAVLLSLKDFAITVGAPSVIPVLLYPLAKRVTGYPQAVLGLTINWGALVGYAAAADALTIAPVCLYGAGWCWTMIYDTIYAHQDKEYDRQIGVKSSALTLGTRTRPVLAILASTKLALLTAAGITADLSTPYFAGITLAGVHLIRHVALTNFDDPKQCNYAFVDSQVTGVITLGALIAGRLL